MEAGTLKDICQNPTLIIAVHIHFILADPVSIRFKKPAVSTQR